MKEDDYMYIGSTNYFNNLQDNHQSITPSWVTSEKYYNCDFYYQLRELKKKRRLFKKANK